MNYSQSDIEEQIRSTKQCDGEVNGLLENLKQELIEIDADYAIVETMRQAYNSN